MDDHAVKVKDATRRMALCGLRFFRKNVDDRLHLFTVRLSPLPAW